MGRKDFCSSNWVEPPHFPNYTAFHQTAANCTQLPERTGSPRIGQLRPPLPAEIPEPRPLQRGPQARGSLAANEPMRLLCQPPRRVREEVVSSPLEPEVTASFPSPRVTLSPRDCCYCKGKPSGGPQQVGHSVTAVRPSAIAGAGGEGLRGGRGCVRPPGPDRPSRGAWGRPSGAKSRLWLCCICRRRAAGCGGAGKEGQGRGGVGCLSEDGRGKAHGPRGKPAEADPERTNAGKRFPPSSGRCVCSELSNASAEFF